MKIQAIKKGKLYDYIANNFYKISKEDLRDLILEIIYMIYYDRNCKKIADYFKMKAIKSSYLPENILIVLYKEEFLGGMLNEKTNSNNKT